MALYLYLALGLIYLAATAEGISPELISNVTLHINASLPLELNKGSVALTCSASGSNISYSWTLRGILLPIYPRYHLIGNHSTLIISPVSRNDFGPFACTASNELNSETSEPLNLSWVPDKAFQCETSKENEQYKFLCSWSGGNPPAIIQMVSFTLNMTGEDEVTSYVPSSQVPFGSNLTCVAEHGNQKKYCALDLDDPYSDGFFNNRHVMVPYGGFLTLAVSLTSKSPRRRPLPAMFHWEAPGGYFATHFSHTSILQKDFVKQHNVGVYHCKAENVMGVTYFIFRVSIARPEVEVTEDTCQHPLSAGAIAGIISLVVLILIANLVVLWWDKFKKKSPDTNINLQENINIADDYSQVPDERRTSV